jgi:hypothetical protein
MNLVPVKHSPAVVRSVQSGASEATTVEQAVAVLSRRFEARIVDAIGSLLPYTSVKRYRKAFEALHQEVTDLSARHDDKRLKALRSALTWEIAHFGSIHRVSVSGFECGPPVPVVTTRAKQRKELNEAAARVREKLHAFRVDAPPVG